MNKALKIYENLYIKMVNPINSFNFLPNKKREVSKVIRTIGITLSILLVLTGGIFGFITYKKNDVKNAVEDHLIKEEQIKREDILTLEPFIANLSGDKKYLVLVQIKNDEKKYYYFKDTKKNIVLLESYILNGKEHVVN